MNRYLLGLAVILVITCSCKKKSEQTGSLDYVQPRCNVDRSIPYQIVSKIGLGDTFTYTYDSLNRVIKMTGTSSKALYEYSYRNDTALFTKSLPGGYKYINKRYVNPNGEYTYGERLVTYNEVLTERDVFINSYDSKHQRIRALDYTYGYNNNGVITYRITNDSTEYVWEDGEITSSVSKARGEASYTYQPETNGLNGFNIPYYPTTDFNFVSTHKPVLCKRLVSNITWKRDGVTSSAAYQYEIDDLGRVIHMVINTVGNIPTGNADFTFRYKCF